MLVVGALDRKVAVRGKRPLLITSPLESGISRIDLWDDKVEISGLSHLSGTWISPSGSQLDPNFLCGDPSFKFQRRQVRPWCICSTQRIRRSLDQQYHRHPSSWWRISDPIGHLPHGYTRPLHPTGKTAGSATPHAVVIDWLLLFCDRWSMIIVALSLRLTPATDTVSPTNPKDGPTILAVSYSSTLLDLAEHPHFNISVPLQGSSQLDVNKPPLILQVQLSVLLREHILFTHPISTQSRPRDFGARIS